MLVLKATSRHHQILIMASNPSSSPDTPVAIKISLSNGENRRFKLLLRELGPAHLTDRVCSSNIFCSIEPCGWFPFRRDRTNYVDRSFENFLPSPQIKTYSSRDSRTVLERTLLLTATILLYTSNSTVLPKPNSSSGSKSPLLIMYCQRQ